MSDNQNEKIMKDVLAFIYSLLVTCVLLLILWWVFPFAIENPAISCITLLILLVSQFGTGLRILAGIILVFPISYLNSKSKLQVVPFGLGLLIALAIPWLGGVSGWRWLRWTTALLYTGFSFETFLAFVIAASGISSDD